MTRMSQSPDIEVTASVVGVRVTNPEDLVPRHRGVKPTFLSRNLDGTNYTVDMLAAAQPNRQLLIICVVAQSSDVAFITGSKADAQNYVIGAGEQSLALPGCAVMGGMVIYLPGKGEVWAAVPTGGPGVMFGVIPVYEE